MEHIAEMNQPALRGETFQKERDLLGEDEGRAIMVFQGVGLGGPAQPAKIIAVGARQSEIAFSGAHW